MPRSSPPTTLWQRRRQGGVRRPTLLGGGRRPSRGANQRVTEANAPRLDDEYTSTFGITEDVVRFQTL